MANTYLTKTFTASNRKTFTVSCWVKRSSITAQQAIFSTGNGNTGPLNLFGFNATDNLTYWEYSDGSTGLFDLQGAAALRDTSAWYHIVLSVDTTQSTASDRVKFYVNGELVTAFDGTYNTYPNQNQDLAFNQADQHAVGRYEYNNSGYFDGLISHFHFIDGTAYAASNFGSTDSVTGEWKINTSPSVTYGTNGFFILKDGNSVTDQSGNSNNFALGGGTLTNTEDCPSNVFATLNPLSYQVASQMSAPPTNGNTTLVSGSGSAWGTLISTIGATTGKYYFEAKCIANGNNCIVGAVDINDDRSNSSAEWYIGQSSTGQGYQNNGAASNGGASYGATYTNGDIIGVAMDLDNSKLYFSKNGVWQNSGVPTSGSTGTGAMSLTAGTTYAFALTGYASTTWYSNFGNGYFSTGAISSEGTNASGIGKFEYDVPTGYTALSTKGLNE